MALIDYALSKLTWDTISELPAETQDLTCVLSSLTRNPSVDFFITRPNSDSAM